MTGKKKIESPETKKDGRKNNRRPNRPTAADEAIIAQRRLEAVSFRRTGMDYRQIGAQLKISAQQAWIDVQAALKETAELEKDATQEYRQLEVERLNRLLMGVWTEAAKGNLGAVDRAIKISERLSKLLGLDTPVKQQIDINVQNWSDLINPDDKRDPFA